MLLAGGIGFQTWIFILFLQNLTHTWRLHNPPGLWVLSNLNGKFHFLSRQHHAFCQEIKVAPTKLDQHFLRKGEMCALEWTKEWNAWFSFVMVFCCLHLIIVPEPVLPCDLAEPTETSGTKVVFLYKGLWILCLLVENSS